MKFFYLLIIFFLFACSDPPTYVDIPPLQSKTTTQRTEGYSETKNAYFGDLHIHTGWSFDAFIFNVRVTPEQAYRYGRGIPIAHVSGNQIQIRRPLDFMAVTDHAEYMGVMIQMKDEENPLSKLEIAKDINSTDSEVSRKAFGKIGFTLATNWPYKDLIRRDIIQDTWRRNVAIADAYYQPGRFTTFAGYEWTSSWPVVFSRPQYAQNMHRNVIFKGGKVAGLPFSSFDSQKPEDLWKWMEAQRSLGVDLIAIPHNANISDGQMYALETSTGKPIDLEYIKTRMRNEPVSEVAQNKGQSMTHPDLSPNDEFADFEVYQYTLGRGEARAQSKPNGSFVRQALKNGLALEKDLGANPFKFGFIGSTDSHNGATNSEENNNIGKSGYQDGTPQVRLNPNTENRTRESSVGGLAGVWAEENTRESIFEALERKEVFATSGPRIKVRFFAGSELDSISFEDSLWLENVYHKGVPMGGNLNTEPTFIIHAIKDAEGANLDRVQVVKGWVDERGETHEKIFNVLWSEGRSRDEEGNLPEVGNTVDLKTAFYQNTIGAIELKGKWKDPEFNPEQSAFYYLRVLEIPTPRWTTYDAVSLNVDLPEHVPSTIQERAWSSPIWYNPAN